MDTAPDRPETSVTPPVIFSVFLVGGLLATWLINFPVLPGSLARTLAALLLLGAGATIYTAFKAMKKHGTTIHPLEGATALVTEGPFRFSRNPLYLSLVAILLGLGFLINSLLMVLLAIGFAATMRSLVIQAEEKFLEAKFGEEYLTYKSQVRRWL